MSDLTSNTNEAPAQIIERPMAVTVFGILNIVFGALGLIYIPVMFLGVMQLETANTYYKTWALVSGIVRFGFAIWLLALGIGLLKLKRWARRGMVIYALIMIVWTFVRVYVNMNGLSYRWIGDIKVEDIVCCSNVCGSLFGGFLYSVLLLIFMLTTKVKQAFAAIGG